MKIKKAAKNNILEIQSLMDELNAHRQINFSKENKEFHKRTKPYTRLDIDTLCKNIFFVAVDSPNNIIGFIQGSIDLREDHKLSKLGYIDELFVSPEHRGRGIAKKLFNVLEKEFIKQDCDHIITHTDIENELSQKFYSTIGMCPTTIELWKKI